MMSVSFIYARPSHAQIAIQWAHNAGLLESDAEFTDIYGLDDDVCYAQLPWS